MKPLYLLLSLMSLFLNAKAQENAMVVRKINGDSFAIKTCDIDSMVFASAATLNAKYYWADTVYTTVHDTLYKGIPASLKATPYTGSRISVDGDNTNYYSWENFANNGTKGQSGAAFGDYLFIVMDNLAAIHLYNLKKKRKIASLALTAHTETISPSSTTVVYHCNQSSFGTIKYAEDDPFPLLYISQRGPASTGRCFVNVLRILPVKNSAGTDYVSFTVQEVQTIYLPRMTRSNALGNANFTIDPQTGYCYSHSRNNTTSDANYQRCRITKFAPIDLSQKEVYLEDKDILESYEIYALDGKTPISALNMQGGCIWNNKYYIAQGYPSCGFIYLRIVDLKSKKLTNDIDLMNDGFGVEPEGVFLYQGKLSFSCVDGSICQFNFK